MTAVALLDRLDGVQDVGAGRWRAICPAHPSKHKSRTLSVRETDDLRVLVKCHAGCSFEEIIGAVGIEAQALFPPMAIEHAKPIRRPFLPQDVFDVARAEIGIAAIIAADMHKNREISEADYQRLFLAVERLGEIANGAYRVRTH